MPLNRIFTGANGLISLAVQGEPAQQADFNAITAAYGETIFNPVGRVVDVEICVQTEVQEFFTIGSRNAMQLLPGNQHVSGKIGRAYINGSLLYLLLGRGAKQNDLLTLQPTFSMDLVLTDPASPTNVLKVNLFGVKFENWAVRVPQETFVMEQVTFKALKISALDKEEGNDVNVAFPEAQ